MVSGVDRDVTPVDDRGDAGFHGLQQSDQRRCVDVIWSEVGGQVDRGCCVEVAGAMDRHTAVGIDEPGHDDAAGGIDDVRIPGPQRRAYLPDDAVLDEYIRPDRVAHTGASSEDRAALDEQLRLIVSIRLSRCGRQPQRTFHSASTQDVAGRRMPAILLAIGPHPSPWPFSAVAGSAPNVRSERTPGQIGCNTAESSRTRQRGVEEDR